MPLPSGTVRVYKAESGARCMFVGEDAIEHTPKNEIVRLKLGQAFDVTARGQAETEFERISSEVFENAFAIEVKNAKPEPVTGQRLRIVPGDWKILQE